MRDIFKIKIFYNVIVLAIVSIFVFPSIVSASIISQQTDKSTVYTIGNLGFSQQPMVTGTSTNLGSLTLSIDNNGCAPGVYFYVSIANGNGDGPYYFHNSATPYDYNVYQCDGSYGQQEKFFSAQYIATYGSTPAGNGLALTANCGTFNTNNCPWNFYFQRNFGEGSAMKGYGKSTVNNSQDAYFIANTNYVPSEFYAQIKNTSGGTINLRDDSNTSANIIKTLPEDWIVRVASTTDGNGNHITANGYNWYKVIDLTDNSSGWIIGSNASSTVYYLPYEEQQQTAFQATSSAYIATSSRPALILDVIDHYYNNTSTSSSLYSSDDGSNDISILKDRNFEEKVLWGIMAQESGGDFNNEYVTYDYGHGISQATFNALYFEPSDPHATWDNRGVGSGVTIIPCASVGTDAYVDCYSGAGTGNGSPKPYKPYADNPSNPTYKQYTNTEQSIYANIKDGLKVLQYKYDNFYPIATSTIVNGTTYSAVERETILATEGYNGACGYVDTVADRLDEIDIFFPTATSSDITSLIQKMHTAGEGAICAQLHSPGELRLEDSKGRIVGVVDGKMKNDFPLALSDRETKIIKILSPEEDGNYTYKIVGTGEGAYSLDVTIKNKDENVIFKTDDIGMLPAQIHSYSIDREALSRGEDGVTIKIDRNGDGIPERILRSGKNLTTSAYNAGATAEEAQASKMGHGSIESSTEEKPVPEGLSYSQIQPKEIPSFVRDRLDELSKIHNKND